MSASAKACSTTLTFSGFANINQKGYGLTECTGGVIHQIDEDESAFGSVGKLFAGVCVVPNSPPV